MLFIHRWLGLITGIVVLIVSITGCIYVFQDEIRDATEPWRKVPVMQQAMLPPSVLQEKALAQHPGAKVSRIIYTGKDRSAAVLLADGRNFYYIYLNPYTGRFLYNQNLRKDFFTIVEFIHLYLLLPAPIGKLVVGGSTLFFVLLMITGIVLWWPKRKVDRKRSFTIKWKGKWKRVNYDLHNVLGFYACSFALVIAVTGLSFSFDWVENGLYKMANAGRPAVTEHHAATVDTALFKKGTAAAVIDQTYQYVKQASPEAEMLLIGPPAKAGAPVSIMAYKKALHFYHSDRYYFNPATGVLVQDLIHAHKSPGMRLNDMNYDIHTGQILGMGGKIVAFIASLICASLPVTGFIIWNGKRKKKPKKTRQQRAAILTGTV